MLGAGVQNSDQSVCANHDERLRIFERGGGGGEKGESTFTLCRCGIPETGVEWET